MAKVKNETPAATTTEAPEAPAAGGREKTKCPVTRERFEKAKQLKVTISDDEDKIIAMFNIIPREMSTGSLGYHTAEKITVHIDGTPCKAQGNVQFILVGSKDLPK